jgi:hypothetical protein
MLTGAETGLSNTRAAALGFEPQHSWRDHVPGRGPGSNPEQQTYPR